MDGMDLLQGVGDAEAEEAAAQLPPGIGEFKMPSLEQMMDLLSKMDIPEEEKEKIMDGFTNKAEVLAKLAGQGAERIASAMNPNRQQLPVDGSQFYVFFFALSLVSLVFAFFGYKLYKSLVEKERKREEKRKLKQQKKKK